MQVTATLLEELAEAVLAAMKVLSSADPGMVLTQGWGHSWPHLHRDWAHRGHSCVGTGLCPTKVWGRPWLDWPTNALSLGTHSAHRILSIRVRVRASACACACAASELRRVKSPDRTRVSSNMRLTDPDCDPSHPIPSHPIPSHPIVSLPNPRALTLQRRGATSSGRPVGPAVTVAAKGKSRAALFERLLPSTGLDDAVSDVLDLRACSAAPSALSPLA